MGKAHVYTLHRVWKGRGQRLYKLNHDHLDLIPPDLGKYIEIEAVFS